MERKSAWETFSYVSPKLCMSLHWDMRSLVNGVLVCFLLWIKSFYISSAKIKLWSFLVYRDSISIFLPAKCSVDICMSRNIVWDFKKQLTTSNMKALVKMCNFTQAHTSCKLIELKLICSSCIIPHYLIHRIKGQKTEGSPVCLRLKPRI